MSDAGGGAGATFSQPTSGTSGLQPYNLEGKAKSLYYVPRFKPRPSALQSRRRNQSKRQGAANVLRKGLPSMDEVLEKMASTLTESVREIIARGGDQQDAALAETQAQFTRALSDHVSGELAKMAPEGDLEPMFKGLGCVSRCAGLVSQIASAIQNAKDGKDWSGSDKTNDPASEEVADMLDASLHCAELALRMAVNEHVEIAAPEELDHPEDGMVYMKLADATAPDDRRLDQLIKSALPEDLMAFATDPALIDLGRMEFGAEILAKCGVSENVLEKLFSPAGMELLEKSSPFDPNQDPNMTSAGDPNQDPNGADPDGDDGSGDGDDPIDVMGRLLAAAMIQLDMIRQIAEDADPTAGADPSMQDPSIQDPAAMEDPSAADPGDTPDAGAAAGDDASKAAGKTGGDAAAGAPPKKKNPFAKIAPGGALAKIAGEATIDAGTLSVLEKVAEGAAASDARVAALAGAVDKLATMVGTMSQTLQPPRGPIGAQLAALEKINDGAAGPQTLDLDAEANRLSKLSGEDRSMALIKLTHQAGGQPII